MKLTINPTAPNGIDHITFQSEQNDLYHRELTLLCITIMGYSTEQKIQSILNGIAKSAKNKKHRLQIQADALRIFEDLMTERIQNNSGFFGDTSTSLQDGLRAIRTAHSNAFSIDGAFV